MNKKYSVLMSLYYKEKSEYLRQSIESMINQTIAPDEIVIVKDGSITAELQSVLNDYIISYPYLFNIIESEKNIGLGLALNLGLCNCRNELVARMDTDDISKPDRCEKQLNEFNLHKNLDLLGSYVDEFYDNPQKIVSIRKVPLEMKKIYDFAKKRSAFNHPSVMYRKTKVLQNGGYRDLRRNQDVDLFGRMLFHGCTAKNISESLLLFRSNDDLAKRRKSWNNTKSYIDVIRKFWAMGYAGLSDYLIIVLAQTCMFILPVRLQHWVYTIFLRR